MTKKQPHTLKARQLCIVLAGVVIIFMIEQIGLLNGVNNYFYDMFFRVRGARHISDRVLIISVDERTLAALGKWPIARKNYALLLSRLKSAAAVGFDLLLVEPSADDALLAEAVKQQARVVLPVYIDDEGRIVEPVPQFLPKSLGHVHIEPDIDGVVRKNFQTLLYQGNVLPSLATKLYRIASEQPVKRRSPSQLNNDKPQDKTIVQMEPIQVNYYGPPGTFKPISMIDVIERKFPDDFFHNKVVLVGLTAAGIADRVMTPFSQQRKGMPGVELHANMLNNLLDGSRINVIPALTQLLIAAVLSLLLLFLFMKMNEKLAALILLFFLALITITSFGLFSFLNLWMPPALIYCLLSFLFLAAYVLKLDDAARKLDLEYSSISKLLGSQEQAMEVAYKTGILTYFTSSGITSKIDNLVNIEKQYERQLENKSVELKNANKKLKEVDQLKSMFIASMSHELRTPLNSVIGFSSIMLKEWIGVLNDEQKQCTASILKSGKHLLSLINDVIDVSKIEAGMAEVKSVDFDLSELLNEVAQTLGKEVRDRGLTLLVPELSLTMHTDRRRLLQCVLNLVSNGLKYTEQGTITLHVRQLGERLEIAVADSGIGISAEDQARLFLPFSRIQSHLTAKVLGTGLGLYLTKKIVTEMLGGDISVVSESEKGSIFTITLPLIVTPKRTLDLREGTNDEVYQ